MSRSMSLNSLMRWFLAVIGIVVAALAGNHFGAHQERNRIAAGDGSQILNPSQEQTYEDRLAQLRVQRDVADESNRSLQSKLEQVQAQLLEQESKQQLYEKIEGTDVSTGLGVDTITKVLDADDKLVELQVTVVQARGRNRVKGRVGVSFMGTRDGTGWREIIYEADASDAPRFDMRFFQTLVVPIPKTDILIETVEIEVRSDGRQHKPVQYEAAWSGILED